jgi:ribonucleoside-diphosphate reductase alpha chain
VTPKQDSAVLDEPEIRVDTEASAPTVSADTSNVGDSPMRVKKRNGDLEPVDLNKIVRAVARCAVGLDGVDTMRVATRTISGLHDGATTEDLDELSIRTAASLIVEEPNYSKLASRLLAAYIDKEVQLSNVHSFSQSIELGHELGTVGDSVAEFVKTNARKLNNAIDESRNWIFDFFGMRTLYDRYLLRHPDTRHVTEHPQYFFLRVACGLSKTPDEAIELYNLLSSLDYLTSSPTLFNSGTVHPQMSSCYLLDSPTDTLEGIYKRYADIAKLSKFAGGIGVAWTRIRTRGSLIRGTNGLSNGIIPWLKTLDASVAAVNQGGRRKGAACVYLESWHADIEEFLELRDNTGDEARRAHNLNIANWINDLFMERVEKDWQWSLFDPAKVPHLTDLYGDEFEQAYIKAEEDGLFERQIPARQLYTRMMRTLAQTGNGWMTFKDKSNRTSNQTAKAGNVIHLSNLCTEILEVTDQEQTAVCNLGSINLGRLVKNDDQGNAYFDFERLKTVTRTAVTYLDRVVDINYYPTPESGNSNSQWRPVGLGIMGLQDVFFKLRYVFDSDEARALSRKISEHIYFNALWQSTELAKESGPLPRWEDTRTFAGELQFDAWGVEPSPDVPWQEVRDRMKQYGLRNSLLIAIAPTATIASIAGAYECIEPQVSNLFKRETLSGEFLQINQYLVRDLKERGLWNEEMANKIKKAEGSVQDIAEIPADMKELYRTAWEIPMRSLIDMQAERGAFIDQSASLNLFIESPTIGKLSSMYNYAWKAGLKTTYYLRSRPATRIRQTTTDNGNFTPEPAPPAPKKKEYSDEEAIACSLENPEACEACD